MERTTVQVSKETKKKLHHLKIDFEYHNINDTIKKLIEEYEND